MIKEIIKRIKEKAIEDDNKYWLRQEEFIQRKDITWNDVSFGQYFFMWCMAGLTWAFIFFVIF